MESKEINGHGSQANLKLLKNLNAVKKHGIEQES